MYILFFGQFLINVYTSNATLLLFSIISLLSPIFIKSKENNPQKIKLGPFHRWPNYVPTHPRIRPAGSGRKGTRVLSFFFWSITRVLSKGTEKKQGLGTRVLASQHRLALPLAAIYFNFVQGNANDIAKRHLLGTRCLFFTLLYHL